MVMNLPKISFVKIVILKNDYLRLNKTTEFYLVVLYNLTNISRTDFSAGDTITMKITRLGSSDTYSETFQMLYIYPYQS